LPEKKHKKNPGGKITGEFELIRFLSSQFGGGNSRLKIGPGDDAAVWNPRPGWDLVFTCDLLTEGIHFDLDLIEPQELGYKALAASISDLAAMGAVPILFLISLSIPVKKKWVKIEFFRNLYRGLRKAAKNNNIVLAGGDTTASLDPLSVDITLVGEVEPGRALRRGAAQPGDMLFCTGTLGDSAAGLALLKSTKKNIPAGMFNKLKKKHYQPVSCVNAGRWIVKHKFRSACMDISDGLASELSHMSLAGKTGFEILEQNIPLSSECRQAGRFLGVDPLKWALYGGEDYELLFTCPPGQAEKVKKNMSEQTGIKINFLGRAVELKKGIKILYPDGLSKVLKGGFDHFKRRD
jgi:thiamine-monophosphate kinase